MASRCVSFTLAWIAAARVVLRNSASPVVCSHIHSLPLVCCWQCALCEWWLDPRICPRGCWACCYWQLQPWISLKCQMLCDEGKTEDDVLLFHYCVCVGEMGVCKLALWFLSIMLLEFKQFFFLLFRYSVVFKCVVRKGRHTCTHTLFPEEVDGCSCCVPPQTLPTSLVKGFLYHSFVQSE